MPRSARRPGSRWSARRGRRRRSTAGRSRWPRTRHGRRATTGSGTAPDTVEAGQRGDGFGRPGVEEIVPVRQVHPRPPRTGPGTGSRPGSSMISRGCPGPARTAAVPGASRAKPSHAQNQQSCGVAVLSRAIAARASASGTHRLPACGPWLPYRGGPPGAVGGSATGWNCASGAAAARSTRPRRPSGPNDPRYPGSGRGAAPARRPRTRPTPRS